MKIKDFCNSNVGLKGISSILLFLNDNYNPFEISSMDSLEKRYGEYCLNNWSIQRYPEGFRVLAIVGESPKESKKEREDRYRKACVDLIKAGWTSEDLLNIGYTEETLRDAYTYMKITESEVV